MSYYYDILVIGSGAAGLSLSLHLAKHHRIALVSKGPLTEGSTYYAQGGIAAVMGKGDSIESHINDTISTGKGLCNPHVVRFTAKNAKQIVRWLINQGVSFSQETRPDGRLDYHLTREGGHSHRRVMHVEDATGQAIASTLTSKVLQEKNITCFEYYTTVDLLVQDNLCTGAYLLNNTNNQVECLQAKIVVLATGGASKVYLYTSNPDTSSGDGIAMAYRKGCRIANMEFNQFHPTCLYHPKAKSFLITEAVRGEGGKLLLPDGTRFMPQFDERAELAPRDIVARAIDHEMKRLGLECVYLDISFKSHEFIYQYFPTVAKKCLQFGFDMTKQPLPVVPAAHYTCGGIMTDLHGQTDITNLYAIGETAHTGLHGANRMASNSLLECLVFAKSASEDIKTRIKDIAMPKAAPQWDESQVTNSDEEIVVRHNWEELRHAMWDYVGIVRTNKRLKRAKNRVDLLKQEIQDYYANFKVGKHLIELRNLVQVAELIVLSAIARKESRGLHYNLDYPNLDEEQLNNTVLRTGS